MIWELTALAGLIIAACGFYLAYPPLVWVAIGVLLVWIGVRGYQRSAR